MYRKRPHPQLTACEPVKRVQNWTARKQLQNCCRLPWQFIAPSNANLKVAIKASTKSRMTIDIGARGFSNTAVTTGC